MKLVSILILLSFCAIAQQKDSDIKAIYKVMNDQQEAWNKANLELFMEGYWKSDSLKFVNSKGITYGWEKTLSNYKRSFPTPEAMGTLIFTIISLEKLSDGSAFMIGKYQLKRITDEPSGHFTLLWRKIKGKWIIVTDHTS